MYLQLLSTVPDSEVKQAIAANGLRKNNCLFIGQNDKVGHWSWRRHLAWVFSLLFVCQALIGLGQTVKTVAGGNGPGNSSDQLQKPTNLFVTPDGVVYVADYENHRIQKWLVGATSGITVAGGNGPGPADNQLNKPYGIFVFGNAIYIGDTENHRVQKWIEGATSGATVAGVTSVSGADNTHLSKPTGIYVSSNTGHLYIADFLNDRIQRFPAGSTSGAAGETVAGGHGEGQAANQFRHPEGVVVDDAVPGTIYIYVADTQNNRIQKWLKGDTQGVTVAGSTTAGSDATHLNYPFSLHRDSDGDLYVADGKNHRIQKFVAGSTTGITVAGQNSLGSDAAHLHLPQGVFVDANKRIYVADYFNDRIQRFGTCAAPVPTLTSSGSGTLTCATTSLILTADGGSAGYTYKFSDNAAQPNGVSSNTASVSQAGVYSVTITNPVNDCSNSTTLSISGSTIPVGAITLNTVGAIGCNPNSVTLSASSTGATNYTLSPTNAIMSNGVFVVTQANTYTVTASNGLAGCEKTTTKTLTQGINVVAGTMVASGPAFCTNPTRLTSTSTGKSFVITGPNGYVFSYVYRQGGTYTFSAGGVKVGGTYTLTIFGGEDCPSTTSSVVVQGSGNCP